MNVTLVFLALLMGAVVWWLVRQTINVKPWAAEATTEGAEDFGLRGRYKPLPSIKVGLGVFLAVATSLFALFISAYSIRMDVWDWRPVPEPSLLWWNTAVLMLASVGLQWAWNAAKREDTAQVKNGLLAGFVCSVAFVGLQLGAWAQMEAAGYLATGNPASAFFYTLTGVHALHLMGGMFAWARTFRRVWRGRSDPERVTLSVELCAVYWHYLLAIWFVLFGLMLAT